MPTVPTFPVTYFMIISQTFTTWRPWWQWWGRPQMRWLRWMGGVASKMSMFISESETLPDTIFVLFLLLLLQGNCFGCFRSCCSWYFSCGHCRCGQAGVGTVLLLWALQVWSLLVLALYFCCGTAGVVTAGVGTVLLLWALQVWSLLVCPLYFCCGHCRCGHFWRWHCTSVVCPAGVVTAGVGTVLLLWTLQVWSLLVLALLLKPC
jgi:hypothetical protein